MKWYYLPSFSHIFIHEVMLETILQVASGYLSITFSIHLVKWLFSDVSFFELLLAVAFFKLLCTSAATSFSSSSCPKNFTGQNLIKGKKMILNCSKLSNEMNLTDYVKLKLLSLTPLLWYRSFLRIQIWQARMLFY